MKVRRAKIGLAGFVVLLAGLVALADCGRGSRLFQLAQLVPLGDKLGHLVLFGTLSFLVNVIQGGARLRVFAWPMLKGSAMILPLVTLEECSQVLLRSRSFDLLDLAADCAGIWLFGRVALAYLKWKQVGRNGAPFAGQLGAATGPGERRQHGHRHDDRVKIVAQRAE